MSVLIGDRATYRGETVVVIGPATFLDQRRWHVRYRNGESFTGWSSEVAPESALADVSTPSFEVGDEVQVGFAPYRRKGTVSAIESGARTLYEVTFAEDDDRYETEGGVRFIQHEHTVTVGAEFLDI